MKTPSLAHFVLASVEVETLVLQHLEVSEGDGVSEGGVDRVAKNDLNSTEQYFATTNSTKKWPKNDLRLPKIAQK